MSSNSDKINLWFDRFDQKFAGFAGVIAETAVEFYRERFEQQNWEGQPWQPLNPAYAKRKKRGSGRILTATGILAGSIWPSEVSVSRVKISAGGSKAPYAKIHNEGGTIQKAARSETFVRNRYNRGPKSKAFGGMGLYNKGTTAGRGLTFKAHSITMPKRQFMGPSPTLNSRILERLRAFYNSKS